MQFSNFGTFLTSGSGIVQLMEDFGDASAAAGPVYMLGGGNPAAIPAMQAHFRTAMGRLADDAGRFDSAVGSYDAPQGESRFREALAALLARTYDWPVTPANIAITNGSQSTFFVLFNLFSGAYPGGAARRILLPLTPEYIGYADSGFGEDIFVSNRPRIELLEDNRFKYHVDLDRFEIDDDIGAVCVSRPTNPTGNVLTDDEVDLLDRRCRERGVPLILDCAYGSPFPNIVFTTATPRWNPNIILCLSLSKVGLPGVRTGIVVAAEPVVRAISAANAIVSLAPGSFGPALVLDAVASGEIIDWSNRHVRTYYLEKSRRAVGLFDHALEGVPYRIHRPEGAIFLWLWLPDLPIDTLELYRRLKARGVYVIAGEYFFPGLPDDGWRHRRECIRVSYAGNDEVVKRGIDIIAEEVRGAWQQNPGPAEP